MSETPRTDAEIQTTSYFPYDPQEERDLEYVDVDFARQLERENNSLRQQLAEQRNKVLEEAAGVAGLHPDGVSAKYWSDYYRGRNHASEAILALRTTQPAKERTENEPE